MRSFCFLQICESRYFWQETILLSRVVQVATKVAQTITHDQIFGTQDTVVRRNLIEYLLSDFHVWRLVFYDHSRCATLASIQHSVAATTHSAHVDSHLVGHQWGRVSQVVDQVVREVLAHPLLGRQRDVTAAQNVKNMSASVFLTYFYVKSG